MGTRSPRPGTVFADRSAAYRIALIGDSFTFSDEVGYEESWAYKLERKLRPQVQVLNFGVSGYGIDQAYLRYTRDVRPWHPDIVVLGYIRADVWRTGRVYEFLSWPEWGGPAWEAALHTQKPSPLSCLMFRFHGLKNLHTNDQSRSCPLYIMKPITIEKNGTNPRGVLSIIPISSAFFCHSDLPMKIRPQRYRIRPLKTSVVRV